VYERVGWVGECLNTLGLGESDRWRRLKLRGCQRGGRVSRRRGSVTEAGCCLSRPQTLITCSLARTKSGERMAIIRV